MTVPVTFAGDRFEHCQQVGEYDPEFTGGTVRAEFTIPQRVFDQLAARRKSWPIPYTADDLLATWRGSDRLLLYVHIADPDDTWTVGLTINGENGGSEEGLQRRLSAGPRAHFHRFLCGCVAPAARSAV